MEYFQNVRKSLSVEILRKCRTAGYLVMIRTRLPGIQTLPIYLFIYLFICLFIYSFIGLLFIYLFIFLIFIFSFFYDPQSAPRTPHPAFSEQPKVCIIFGIS